MWFTRVCSVCGSVCGEGVLCSEGRLYIVDLLGYIKST